MVAAAGAHHSRGCTVRLHPAQPFTDDRAAQSQPLKIRVRCHRLNLPQMAARVQPEQTERRQSPIGRNRHQIQIRPIVRLFQDAPPPARGHTGNVERCAQQVGCGLYLGLAGQRAQRETGGQLRRGQGRRQRLLKKDLAGVKRNVALMGQARLTRNILRPRPDGHADRPVTGLRQVRGALLGPRKDRRFQRGCVRLGVQPIVDTAKRNLENGKRDEFPGRHRP